ncbi:acyl-CoA dehydratase activase [Bengtsoniella intestinalis]|uniref:acyl-CoA dehydratase activase n=1 Tax=Bengtsoniella intestinalis TaxID=3073143 RepID=UPI00391FB8E6
MYQYFGLDLGTSTVKGALLDEQGTLMWSQTKPHHGAVVATALELLTTIATTHPDAKVMFTGFGAKAFSTEDFYVGELPAICQGVNTLFPTAKSAIDMGGQRSRYVTGLDGNLEFATNAQCAGGTGSFFEDQMSRLGLNMEDYSTLVSQATSVPRLSGRCSVFAKTDLIHRQQEGVSTPDILLGLCYATVRNFKATVVGRLPVATPMALCGGVAENTGVVTALQDIFNLEDAQLLISPHSTLVQAIGAAQLGQGIAIATAMELLQAHERQVVAYPTLSPLPQVTAPEMAPCVTLTAKTPCTLGIDIGSTSTNLVLINADGGLVERLYLRTSGDPQSVVRQGLQTLQQIHGDRISISAVGVTGSGRHLIGKLVDADAIHDEITAQATAALRLNPQADTVFEIGGQDSKYIQLQQGNVVNFKMNKICAAGTGSFLEEQAQRLGVAVTDYGDLALTGEAPVDLGDRCSVFIEENLSVAATKGATLPNLLSGLAHCIIQNYLVKVVGQGAVGDHIVLQGGVCYNAAVVSAFQAVYGDRLTVSPHFAVSGAYGVALLAQQEQRGASTFRGFDLQGEPTVQTHAPQQAIAKNIALYQKGKTLLLGDYTREMTSGKPVIGVPYVLVIHKFFPMIRNFFEALGYQVLLSPDTNEEIVALSQQHAKAETCYPVKLIYGHMVWLAQQNVDYIFMPSIHTMKHETSKVYHNYGCVYMQSAPRFIFEGCGLDKQGIKLLNPSFSLDFGQEAMAKAMVGVGVSLGKPKPVCAAALMQGAMAVRKYTKQVEQLGQQVLDTIAPEDKVLVLVTRTYGIEDPVLNLGLPEQLLSRGYKVLTTSHLPGHSIELTAEYENLYWPFGQHVVSTAKLIAAHPNLYAVYLTTHGCAPDTMIAPLFRKEMGDKPYLEIEVDEHDSTVGVITRVEAFLHSLSNRSATKVEKSDVYFSNLAVQTPPLAKAIPEGNPVYLPHLYPYSTLLSKTFGWQELSPTNPDSLHCGKGKTFTKEYLSFASMLGDALALEETLTAPATLILPQTEGSEADGLYPRVIADFLAPNSPVTIVPKTLETLPVTCKQFENFYLAILAGDVVRCAPREQQAELIAQFTAQPLTLAAILTVAKQLPPRQTPAILVVGEPAIVYSEFLTGGVLNQLQTMSYGEYLWFLWQRRLDEKVVAPITHQLLQVHQALGTNSPISPEPMALEQTAKSVLGTYAGGNGGYRYAKAFHTTARAIVDAASLYENTQTVLSLQEKDRPIPQLYLGFEGTDTTLNQEKLQAFIHYLPKEDAYETT